MRVSKKFWAPFFVSSFYICQKVAIFKRLSDRSLWQKYRSNPTTKVKELYFHKHSHRSLNRPDALSTYLQTIKLTYLR